MGTSIALSINSLLRVGSTRLSLLWKVVWRSFQLFLIGLIIINPNYCQGPCRWLFFTIIYQTSREFAYQFTPSFSPVCSSPAWHVRSVLGQPPYPWCAAAPGLVLPGCSLPGPVGGERPHRRLFSGQPALWFLVSYLILSIQCFHMWILWFQEAWWSKGVDVLMYWPAWLCVLVLETVWLCLTFLLPVPDCPQWVKQDTFVHITFMLVNFRFLCFQRMHP